SAHVKEGQEDLRGRDRAGAQQLVVDLVELALPHRAGRLQVVDHPGPKAEIHHPHAAGDRAAGDHDHRVAALVQRGDLVADGAEDVPAYLTALVADDRGAELDDDRVAHSSGSRSKATPAITTSSPAWNPSSCRARSTPIPFSRCSR